MVSVMAENMDAFETSAQGGVGVGVSVIRNGLLAVVWFLLLLLIHITARQTLSIKLEAHGYHRFPGYFFFLVFVFFFQESNVL